MPSQKIPIRSVLFAVLLIASIVLGACAAPTPAPTEVVEVPTPEPTQVTSNLETISQADLVGATWQWTGGRESPTAEATTVPDPESYTLTFGDDGSLFIQADCNTSRATYELSGDQLTISPGATTRMACPPDSLSDQFLAMLGQAAQVGTAYGNLVIVLDSDAEMFFQRAPAINLGADLTPVTQEELIDTLWQWTNLVETQPMADTTIDDPENYNIVFRADGTYSAKADCNVLNGSYELVGSQLTIQPGITTLAACAPDSKYDLYTSLLARVTGAGTREGTLVLLLDDGTAAMSYENAGESPVPTPAAAAASEPATVLGTPDGVENFDNTNNWTNFDTACFSTEITGGQFVMTANGQAQSACWEFSWPRLDNFYIETTLQMPESCDPQDRFGLIFRAPDNNRGYLYGFDCAGQYSLTIWDGQATTVLVPPTANAAIVNTPGGVNVMGLMAFEENISLYANGVYLETVSDYTYLDEGRIGYFVRAATDNPFTVRYDQLKVWVLEDELYPPDLAQPLPPIAIEPPSGDTASGEARVNVNVRTGPSMLFPILGTAPEGTTGQILGISPDGSWYAISVPTSRVGTGIAWSAADFVTLSNPTGQPLPVITPPLLPTTINFATPPQFAPQVVMREPATLRSGPTLEFPVFGVAPTGSRAEVVGESQDGEWWALRLPSNLASDNTGWVPKIFTVASNIPANLQVIPTPNLPRNINPAAPASGAPSLITREPLNVRSGPGNDYPSLGMVPLGTVMAVVGVSPDREHFVVNVPIDINATGTGWVAARFVRAENVSNVPVVQPPPVP
jgi:heat shock protein HslJ/uncharacterized protein YraI